MPGTENETGLGWQGRRASCGETQRSECCGKGVSRSCGVTVGRGIGCTGEGDPQRQKALDHGPSCVCLSWEPGHDMVLPFPEQKLRRSGMWRGTGWGSTVRIKELV